MSNSLKEWINPLSKLFFYALILALPFNITWVRFTETSFYYGYHAFYNTIFISLTDFLICGLVLIWLYESYVSWKRNSPTETLLHKLYTAISQDILIRSTVIFWLVLAISACVSRETWLSFYGLWKISEFLLVFLYLSRKHNRLNPPYLKGEGEASVAPPLKLRGGWEGLLSLIVLGAVIQSGIGVFQYLGQHSLGLQRFGETFFAPGMKGIAEFYTHSLVSVKHLRFDEIMSGGREIFPIVRAYGTFPHSNVLAAFLFFGLVANIALIYPKNSKKHNRLNPPYLKGEGEASVAPPLKLRGGWEGLLNYFRETLLAVSLILISTGLTLTFSRTVWAVTALTLVILFVISRFHRNRVFNRMQSGARETGVGDYHPRRIAWVLILLVICFGINWVIFGEQIKDRISPPREGARLGEVVADQSYQDRQVFSSISWEMIKAHPIFGSGLRSMVSRMDEYSVDRILPYLHQPVHNIYLLLWVETGILGLGTFLYLLFNIVRRGIKLIIGYQLFLLIAFIGFLLLGFFDHYFISLNQGGLIFWIVAGLVANRAGE